MQGTLFGAPAATNGFRDPSFSRNKNLPMHRWIPWVAGFSAEFVEDCLNNYIPTRNAETWVLDPFSGVGTTLVEAYVRGINVVGFEINPYAALASDLKVHSTKISIKELSNAISVFEKFMEKAEGGLIRREPRSSPPTGFTGRHQLFSQKIQRKVLYALDYIQAIGDRTIRDIFRLALGSVMISFSNYSYEPSLTRRIVAGKPNIEDANVGLSLSAKLRLMLEDIGWLQGHLRTIGARPKALVVPKSIFSAPDSLPFRRFADLVITSPPYLNNYHYPRNTRPQMHWLGFTKGTGYSAAGEDESFGRFWQTVRSGPALKLSFEFPELAKLIECVRQSNQEKGAYGGPGWANYVATYFNDANRFCKVLSVLLKRKAVAVIVLGNSIIQGIEIKTDHMFGKIAEQNNLTYEHNIVLRKKRIGNSIVQSSVRCDHPGERTILYESAIILRR